ncbi:MAG: hypothetical protein HDT38_01125 [Clostridiales bacterium]|nr:hypothetical protein [Clostridiales bacterium]
MPLPYGFMLAPEGNVSVDQEKANTVRTIYQQYLSGMSLKGIADFLFTQGIPSPRGKAQWTQAVINELLSNQRYIGSIIGFDEFFMVQGEKGKRSNLDEDANQRKATRYNSQSVLSGLLVCGECGRNYRRITRPSGKVVWRCANRVEHGKRFCKHSPSISEQQIKDAICVKLGLTTFDEQAVKRHLDFISIRSDGALEVEMHQLGLSLT